MVVTAGCVEVVATGEGKVEESKNQKINTYLKYKLDILFNTPVEVVTFTEQQTTARNPVEDIPST